MQTKILHKMAQKIINFLVPAGAISFKNHRILNWLQILCKSIRKFAYIKNVWSGEAISRDTEILKGIHFCVLYPDCTQAFLTYFQSKSPGHKVLG